MNSEPVNGFKNTNKSLKPIIAIPADRKLINTLWYHCTGEKYISAVIEGVQGVPWVIPSISEMLDMDFILGRMDGLLLTGSYSNIEPHRYGESKKGDECLCDPNRDETVLSLISKTVEKGIPLLGICRGLQEINVAFGGTLHQQVHRVPGFDDHREGGARPQEVQYGLAHDVHLKSGGLLARLAGSETESVNSLHGQGIDSLGEGLTVEAVAPDGLIEAVQVKGSKSFALAVQWHPEWQFQSNHFYSAIFNAFGDACRKRASAGTH